MWRSVVALSIAWVSLVAPSAAAEEQLACIPAAQCCKVCDTGKACGNTCIAARLTCHKGRGCACDASEICVAPSPQ